MRSPRALPDRRLSTQTGEVILARTLTVETFSDQLKETVLQYVEKIDSGSFYVRLERRGHAGEIHSPTVEQAMDHLLQPRNGSWITKVRASSRSLSQIRPIYCGCAGFGQIFRSFSGNVEKGRQLRSPAFGVLTYSVYAPRAKNPAALLDGLFEHSPFSLNSHHYSPQTIEISDSNQTTLVTIANLGQAPHTIQKCLITTKGSRKNTFPGLGAETPVWQGARTAHTPRMERTSNAARRDGSTLKQGKVFLREP